MGESAFPFEFFDELAYPIDGRATAEQRGRGTIQAVGRWDDDDWTGEPPEGRYDASRADPDFWRGRAPLSFVGAGIGIALIILLIVVLL